MEKLLPSVSIMVPVKNAEEHLPSLIAALSRQDYPHIIESLFVFDSPSPLLEAKLQELGKTTTWDVHILYCTQGLSLSRLYGVKKAQGDYISFIDADCIPKSDWVSTMMETILRWEQKDPHFVGVGGSNINPTHQKGAPQTIHLMKDSFLGSYNSVYGRTFTAEQELDHIATVNALYKREVLTEDLFHPALTFSGEDLFMSQRLRQMGWRFAYCPAGAVQHTVRENLLAWTRNMWKYGRGRAFVLTKFPRMFWEKPLYLAPLMLALSCVSLPFLYGVSFAFLPLLVYFGCLLFVSSAIGLRRSAMQKIPLLMLYFFMTHIAYGFGEIRQFFDPKTYTS